ncbi:hypothetical protein FRX31_013076 [Thalictrum thalictroides]|uniref:Uncharacterized protein n=1 Tax=Thalictrum thalictroides TaxID=46969 RepID=A0A7J6WKB3_THATH|nr:hypothetical protein FRX31_013076 [Thalictrum thalictroides]
MHSSSQSNGSTSTTGTLLTRYRRSEYSLVISAVLRLASVPAVRRVAGVGVLFVVVFSPYVSQVRSRTAAYLVVVLACV